MNLSLPDPLRCRSRHARTPHLRAAVLPRPSERAVALVITLLLLSVITFMAVTFLVISRSEKGAVTTATDQAIARLAADTGFEQAMAQSLGSIMAYTNPFALDLIVSTNYVRPGGFISGNRSLTNVSFATPI